MGADQDNKSKEINLRDFKRDLSKSLERSVTKQHPKHTEYRSNSILKFMESIQEVERSQSIIVIESDQGSDFGSDIIGSKPVQAAKKKKKDTPPV